MYRGCRRLVCSLACVFSILFMLFLDTCTVKADGFGNVIDYGLLNDYVESRSYTLTVVPTSSTSYQYVITTNGSNTESGTISSISGTPSSYRGSGSFTLSNTTSSYDNEYYQCHFRIPMAVFGSVSSVNLKDLYCFCVYASNASSSVGTIQNICITYDDEILYTQGNSTFPCVYKQGYEFLAANGAQAYVGLQTFFEFDYVYSVSEYTVSDNDTINTTISFNTVENIWHVNSDATQAEIEVHDSVNSEQLESISSTEQDTNTKITDFFGSFFDNLLHIFVPEDGYFSTWFDKVNTLLSDKLGMLYAPFDLVISTLQAIYSSSTTESGIPFPGIKWEDTWLVEPFTFTFASLGNDFDDLRDKVYFATDTVLVLTFLMLLQSKVKLILEGHE